MARPGRDVVVTLMPEMIRNESESIKAKGDTQNAENDYEKARRL
jgi:hypothetical protein